MSEDLGPFSNHKNNQFDSNSKFFEKSLEISRCQKFFSAIFIYQLGGGCSLQSGDFPKSNILETFNWILSQLFFENEVCQVVSLLCNSQKFQFDSFLIFVEKTWSF